MDARGIHWRTSWLAGWRNIAWDEARAFARITYPNPDPAKSIGFPKEPFSTVYLLDAPSATLLWRAPSSNHEAAYAPAQRLIQLVAARTQLPLRDLSALASKLAQPKSDPPRVLAEAIAESGATDVPATLRALTQPIRRSRAEYAALAYLAFISVAL
jgi:hypothetical protein